MSDVTLPQLRISASQIEEFLLCNRKWWLASVRKVTQPATATTVFGSVLHGVLERWFWADDNGRDRRTGEAMDLYPQGWHIARNRWKPQEIEGEISPAEQDLIKRLVVEAQQAGLLERRPNRHIEAEFKIEVVPSVTLAGFIDLLNEDEVVDHKSTKSMKWAKSSKGLTESPQMLVYAYSLLDTWRSNGFPPPPEATIGLRHNQFCKDPSGPRVRAVTASVTAEYLDRFWAGLVQPVALAMQGLKASVETYSQIPEPSNTAESCNAYGGCPYRDICHGGASIQQYEEKLARAEALKKSLASAPKAEYTLKQGSLTPPEGGTDMSKMMSVQSAIAAAQAAGRQGAPVQPVAVNAGVPPTGVQFGIAGRPAVSAAAHPIGSFQPAPAPTPQPVQAPQPVPAPAPPPAQQAPAADVPPWADPSCTSCGGIGFSQKGSPCRICVGTAPSRAQKFPQAGVRLPSDFNMTIPGDGTVIWEAKDGSGQGGQLAIPGLAAVPVAPAPAQPPPPPPAQEAPAAPQAPAAPSQQDQSEPAAAEPSKRGRKKAERSSFMLIVGVAVDRSSDAKPGSGRFIYRLSEVLTGSIYPQLVTAMGVDHWAKIDVFRRRDEISANGQAIAAMFGNDIVVFDGPFHGQSDMRALYDAILPFAGEVFIATAAG